MNVTARIDLAHVAGFRIGPLEVRPGTRELVGGDGTVEVLEPRVMQVLVALARAGGAILTRDDLTRFCWDGRVVGEDAINRVMARLRRVADGIGEGVFRIETITKVGYRLVESGDAAATVPASPSGETPAPPTRLPRRGLIAGGIAAAAVAGVGGWSLVRSEAPPPPTERSVRLLDQALFLFCQGTSEGFNQAIGLLRLVVNEEPSFADGWGALAMTYALLSPWRPVGESAMLRDRARAAADRAAGLDPENAFAAIARAHLRPVRGGWLGVDRALAAARGRGRGELLVLYDTALLQGEVGRARESADLLAERRRRADPSASQYFAEIMASWSADRLEEVDRLLDVSEELYPGQTALWFARLYIQIYTGRADASLAMIGDVAGRPFGIPAAEIDDVGLVARAMLSRRAEDVAAAMRAWLPRARTANGHSENAIQYAAALGQVDQAYAILGAHFFDRGFTIPDIRFSSAQSGYSARENRRTTFLFFPSMAAVRADPRFPGLVRELGLEAYWRESGSRPDYRRA